MKYFQKLPGERIYLSPITTEDAEQYCLWLNNLELTKYLSLAHQQIGVFKEKQLLTKMLEQGNQVFAIVEKSTDQLLGNCSLFNLNLRNSIGELGIFIGESQYLGKGYGEEAINLLLDYGFNIYNLHNIMLEVYAYNTRAIKCYQKCGFQFAGRRREEKQIAGQRFDLLYMDILRDEFQGSTLQCDLSKLVDERLDG
jgi:RimJ/RimL family protein N-acetyltransferase